MGENESSLTILGILYLTSQTYLGTEDIQNVVFKGFFFFFFLEPFSENPDMPYTLMNASWIIVCVCVHVGTDIQCIYIHIPSIIYLSVCFHIHALKNYNDL